MAHFFQKRPRTPKPVPKWDMWIVIEALGFLHDLFYIERPGGASPSAASSCHGSRVHTSL